MSCNFYQIAYSEESLKPIHPGFKIFNQIGKPYLDERETSHMIDFFDAGYVKDDGNFYSLVSVGIAIFISEISAMFFYFINIKKFLKDKKIKINERFFYLTLFIIIHTCLLISLATIIDVSIVFYLYTLITFVIFIFNIKRLSSKKTSNLLKMKFKLIK